MTKLSHEIKELIYDEFAGGCTATLGDFYHWDTKEFLATEDDVAEALDEMEVYECPGCGWWSHGGESYLGHKEGCECGEGVCGDCCEGEDDD